MHINKVQVENFPDLAKISNRNLFVTWVTSVVSVQIIYTARNLHKSVCFELQNVFARYSTDSISHCTCKRPSSKQFLHVCTFVLQLFYIKSLYFLVKPSTKQTNMDDTYFDQYDYYNFGGEYNKIAKGSGGHAKHKGKKQNLKYAPSGNVRLVVTNIQNAEKKEKQARQRLNSV